VLLQELIVGALLHLDQVGHRSRFRDLAERTTNFLLASIRQSHRFPLVPAPGSEPAAIRFLPARRGSRLSALAAWIAARSCRRQTGGPDPGACSSNRTGRAKRRKGETVFDGPALPSVCASYFRSTLAPAFSS